MQPEQQCVQFRVVAGGAGVEVDLTHLGGGQGVPDRALAAGFGGPAGRVLVRLDEPVVFGVPVDAAESGDEVLGGTAPTP